MDPNLYQGLNQLLQDLTMAQRNIQILHWNVKATGFIYLHEYFGELYQTLFDYIDITAEQIRFQRAFPTATLKDSCTLARVRPIESNRYYSHDEAIEIIISIIRYLKQFTDHIITYADNNEEWAVVDVFSEQSAHYDKVLYFLENSLVD